MSREVDNERFVRLSQGWLASQGHDLGAVDGWAGARTRAAWEAETGHDAGPSVFDRPTPDDRSLRAFYGEPGDETNLVVLDLPYPMRLAWNLSITVMRTRCHRMVKEPLRAALESVRDLYGSTEELQAAGMDRFGGVFNARRQRGSGRGRPWSLHAWGAAVDLDPARNGLDMPWPHASAELLSRAVERWKKKRPSRPVIEAKMPADVVSAFELVGWKSGGRAWGRDAMHFQWTL